MKQFLKNMFVFFITLFFIITTFVAIGTFLSYGVHIIWDLPMDWDKIRKIYFFALWVDALLSMTFSCQEFLKSLNKTEA